MGYLDQNRVFGRESDTRLWWPVSLVTDCGPPLLPDRCDVEVRGFVVNNLCLKGRGLLKALGP